MDKGKKKRIDERNEFGRNTAGSQSGDMKGKEEKERVGDQKQTQDKGNITKMNPGLTWLMDFA